MHKACAANTTALVYVVEKRRPTKSEVKRPPRPQAGAVPGGGPISVETQSPQHTQDPFWGQTRGRVVAKYMGTASC